MIPFPGPLYEKETEKRLGTPSDMRGCQINTIFSSPDAASLVCVPEARGLTLIRFPEYLA